MEESTTLARRTDPETSKAAARQLTLFELRDLRKWAADCVRKSPGLTQRELGDQYCPSDLRKIGRRLAECEKKGLVRRGPARKCSITGRSAETWYPPEISHG